MQNQSKNRYLRYLRNLMILLLILAGVYAVGRTIHVYLGNFYSGARGPYLQLPATDAMTLRWQTREKGKTELRYGFVADQLVYKVLEQEPATEHEIRLTGLRANSRYYYTISMNGKLVYGGSQYWFETPAATPLKESSTRFLVLGDPGYNGEIQSNVRDAITLWLSENPRKQQTDLDFLLTTGDNAYRSGTNEQFQKGFFEPFSVWLRNVPVWPAYGNHDARRNAFFKIFSLPANAESGGYPSGTEHYYSFDVANTHIVMLDSQGSSLKQDSAQLSWLKKDLEQNKKTWTVAVFHHPPYTRGSHHSDNRSDSGGRMVRVRENLLPVLENAGVDLVLTGHSHMYERSQLMACHYGASDTLLSTMQKQSEKQDGGGSVYFKPMNNESRSGTVYAVVGSSSKLNDGPLDHPANSISLKEAGALFVDVGANTMEVRFLSSSAKVVDYFSIEKKNDYSFSFNCE